MCNDGRLEGKTAIITGAASGIGRATAFLFAEHGAKLVLADVNESALQEIAAAIDSQEGKALIKKIDVSVETEVKSLVQFTLENFGQVDILCNNAGIVGEFVGIDQDNVENWQQVYAVNVLGAMAAIKYVAPHMQSCSKGAIVNTASVAGIRAGAGTNAYSASKAALINFTKTAACDLGQFNIRVNAVCPGLTETGMTKPVFDMARDSGKEHKLGSRCELRRYGRPEEIAQAILFLASDEASYITGQALAVDGGNTASLNLPGMKF